LLKDHARHNAVTVRLHDPEGSWLEGVLARGDRTVADAIELAYRNGARFDSWGNELKLDIWLDAFDKTKVEPNRFLQAIPLSAHLPWSHIDIGVKQSFLEREYHNALSGRPTPPCGKPVDKSGATPIVCYHCGIGCDLERLQGRREAFSRELDDYRTEPLIAAVDDASTNVTSTDQGEPVRIRLGYRKLGRAAFTSHLDMIRLLSRICRRARLPLCYSQGFHPKALMTFGPALSLGVYSLAEFVDIKVYNSVDMDIGAIAGELTRASLGDLPFFAARKLDANDAKLNRVIDQAVYVAALPYSALESLGVKNLEELAARIDERRRSNPIVERDIEGVIKSLELNAYLLDVNVAEGNDVLAQAGFESGYVPITLSLRVTNTGTVNVKEALIALLGSSDISARYVRASLLWTRDGVRATPLDLEILRNSRG
jgi:radical SAM-linked protein